MATYRNTKIERLEKLSALEQEIQVFGSEAPNAAAKAVFETYHTKATKLKVALNQRVEWVFTFVGGGWNTEWALTKEEAIEQAKAEGYQGEINWESFHVSSEDEMQNLLRSFW